MKRRPPGEKDAVAGENQAARAGKHGRRTLKTEPPLVEALADRRRLFLVTCTGTCPLGFTARLVWSSLLLRARRARSGASRRKIARALGVGRAAVGTAVREFVQQGLVSVGRRGRVRAVEPAGDAAAWFVGQRSRRGQGRKATSWHDSYASFPLWLPGPECPLTDRQNAVLWLLVSLLRGGRAGRGVTARYLARLLRIDPATAATALERLGELEVISARRREGYKAWTDIRLLDPPPGFRGWFLARAEARPAPEPQEVQAAASPVEETRQDNSLVDDRGYCEEQLRPLGVPDNLIGDIAQEVWGLLDVDPRFDPDVFMGKLARARKVHAKTGDVDHPGFYLRGILRSMRQEADRNAAQAREAKA